MLIVLSVFFQVLTAANQNPLFKLLACWVILYDFLSFAIFFSKWFFSTKKNSVTKCKGPDQAQFFLSGLIWVQTALKCYLQTVKVVRSR